MVIEHCMLACLRPFWVVLWFRFLVPGCGILAWLSGDVFASIVLIARFVGCVL